MSRRYTKTDLATLKANGLGADLGSPPLKKKRQYPEFKTQSAFVKKWRANCRSFGIAQCLGFHVPNGSVMGGGKAEWQIKERHIRGRLQKLAGVEDGVCDWFLSAARGKYHGFYIEFKSPDGDTSDEQKEFIKHASEGGYQCSVHTDAEAAWFSLLQYVNLP